MFILLNVYCTALVSSLQLASSRLCLEISLAVAESLDSCLARRSVSQTVRRSLSRDKRQQDAVWRGERDGNRAREREGVEQRQIDRRPHVSQKMRNLQRECSQLKIFVSPISLAFILATMISWGKFVKLYFFFFFCSVFAHRYFDLRFPLSLAFNGQHEFDSFQRRVGQRKEIAIKMRANVSVANVAKLQHRLQFRIQIQLQLQPLDFSFNFNFSFSLDRAAIRIWIWQLARARKRQRSPRAWSIRIELQRAQRPESFPPAPESPPTWLACYIGHLSSN